MNNREHELLLDPPQADYHLGGFAGYRRGRRLRGILIGVGLLLFIAAISIAYWFTRRPEPYSIQIFELPPGAELAADAQILSWSSGKARFALRRAYPGVHTIELPDQRIRLAEDCDYAQIRVHVQDQKTISLTVLHGEIVQEAKP